MTAFAVLLAISLFFVLATASKAHGGEDHDVKDSDDHQCTSVRTLPDSEASYSYMSSSEVGPSRWGEVNGVCKTGKRQSPINVITTPFQPRNTTRPNSTIPILDLPPKVVLKYIPEENNFKLKCADGGKDRKDGVVPTCGSVTIGGIKYNLAQTHWHSPSEHYIDGKRYPLEVHMVFSSSDGKLAVVGTMYSIGKSDPMIASAVSAAMRKDYAVVKLPGIDDGNICTWAGSLTTPPCTEGVFWIMNQKIYQASLKEIGEFRAMVGERPNARPLKPSNARKITCYK